MPVQFHSPFRLNVSCVATMPRDRKFRERCSEVASKGPPLKITDIHIEWDGDLTIRGRLREGKPFLHEQTEKLEDISTCVKNSEVLMPVLSRMRLLEKKTLPAVEDLREEICKALTLSKRSSQEDLQMVVDTAAHIKRLCGFVKMKCRRGEPSSATQMHIVVSNIIDMHACRSYIDQPTCLHEP